MVALEAPHVGEKLGIKSFGAAGRQVGPDAAKSARRSLRNPPHTERPPKVEEDHGVGGGNAVLQGVRVPAVHDPTIGGGEACVDAAPFVARRFNPARLPEMLVEMDDGQAGRLAKPPRERRFAGAGSADDCDTLP